MSNINNVLWAQQLGGTFPDGGLSIAADTLGNTYVTGAFNGTATFGNTTLTSTSFGYSDAFVAKFDSNKTVLWAQKLGGTLTDYGFGITVDEAGNSYATGYFSGTATFGNTTLTSAGNEDGFITKLDSSGNVLWAQKLGSTSSDFGFGITTDGVENIYVTGALNVNSLSTSDTFIRKLDKNGNILWTKNLGGTSPDSGFGITNDKDGNIYVSGFFSGTATFDNITLSSVGNNDAFITKLDSSGNFLWAKNFGGTSDDRGRGIIVDETGNAYFTGYFSDSATFGSTTFSSAGNSDVFVTKLDNNGNTLWARNLGGTESDEGYGIVADKVGNIYVSGIFSSTGTFGNTTLTSAGDSDAFIAKLDSNGNVFSAQKFGGTLTDFGTGIATDGKGNIYATGGFSDTASFGNTSLTSTGNSDVFVIKLGDEVQEPKITLAPNNTGSVFNLAGAATPVEFVLKSSSRGVVNEIGLFIVDDDKGTIDGIAPNDSNYTQAALTRSRSIFSTLGNSPKGFDTNLTRTLDLDSDIRFRLLLVQNGTLDGLRNGTVPLSQLLLSSPTSLQVSDAGNSNFDLRFEDSPGSGQFNDAVVQMQLGTQANKPIGIALQDQQEGEVLDLRGLIGTQNATFTVNREAAYNNFVGFFRVADAKGGINTNGDGIGEGDLLPGQAGYGEAAVKNRVGGIGLSVGNQGKATFTGQFEPG